MSSYALRKIITYLDSKNIKYTWNNPSIGVYTMYNHGILIPMNDGIHYLSIQTHFHVIGPAFAETLLHTLTNDKLGFVDNKKLGYIYHNAIRFYEPDEVFEHIALCMSEFK
jgi:hypothetical protein